MNRGAGLPTGLSDAANVAITGGFINSIDVTTITSGTYTPALTNATNITGSSTTLANFLRIGNIVTVSGNLTIDPTAASASTILRISLPIASTIGAAADAAGVGSCISVFGLTGGIQGSVGNGTAALTFISDAAAGNVSWTYIFTYIVH